MRFGSEKKKDPNATAPSESPVTSTPPSTNDLTVTEEDASLDLLRNCEDRRNEHVIAKYRTSLSETLCV